VDTFRERETARREHGGDHQRDRHKASRRPEQAAITARCAPEIISGRWRGLTGRQGHTGQDRRHRRERFARPIRLIALGEFIKSVHRSPMALYRPTTGAGTAESGQEDGDEEDHDDHDNYRLFSSLLVAGVRRCLAEVSSPDTEGSRPGRQS
jgi:hypothetical protein